MLLLTYDELLTLFSHRNDTFNIINIIERISVPMLKGLIRSLLAILLLSSPF
jgi:hypothetical protein